MTNPFGSFPTLHPLVVHTPVVLLPLATLMLIAALGLRNKTLEWVSVALLAVGWVGTLLASRVFHPHTDVMTLLAQEALGNHEFWANWTQALSTGALLAVLTGMVRWPRPLQRALRTLALVLCLGAAMAVTVAGHYGAMLTHVYKVKVEKE